ncbi:hypothetical protein N6H13_10470 [Paenibacillus sp. CC-CFT742]|uniref:hypothetical protein n=1 Tax=Paenibacillus illinoisensis TaxID=59845 RepID=UPI0025778C47|nr:hypothetical protein [Paenibacillus sp. CC-CFT742]WJH30960.1 hypothetical protein N6H13_10470 [Paenibacillus sp. CC-CFT742]
MKGMGGVLAMFTKKEPEINAPKSTQATNQRYSKVQFAESRQLGRMEKDILAAVLLENETYTVEEAQQHIQQFMNEEAQ